MTTDEWIKLAACRDETRPNLFGVWTAYGKKFATDGHRAHLICVPGSTGITREPPADGCQPYKIDQVIPHDLGVALDGKLLLRAVKQAVKNFGRHPWVVSITSEKGRLIVRQMNAGVLIPIDGKIPRQRDRRIYEPNTTGEVVMQLVGDFKPSDEVCFNGKYLLDAIGTRPGKIHWFNDGPLDPGKFTHADGRIAVVMPLRK